MAPGIGRSFREGFRAAGRSWAGIGVFAAGWLIIILLVILGVALTNPPADLFRGQQAALTTPDAPSAATAARPAADTPAMEAWFGRAWPMLLLAFLFVITANVWLTGGQLGYLAARMRGQPAGVSEFWRSAGRAFGPLLGGTVLAFLVQAALVLFVLINGWILSLLPGGGRGWPLVLFAVLVWTPAIAALLWILIRLSLWFVAIVVDRLGPVAGLKASFRMTRGYWWKLAGMGLLLALISYGVWLPVGLLEWAGSAAGGAAAMIFGVVGNLLGTVASLYVGFAMVAAFIQFYADAKPAAPSGAPS